MPRETEKDIVHRELAVRAFADGFAVGADPHRSGRRSIVEPDTHAHWRAGFNAGRCAAADAQRRYSQELRSREDEARP